MKPIVLFCLGIALYGSSSGQCISYNISPSGDTINCLDKDSLRQGKWVVHVNELRGEPGYEEEGVFINDKKEGYWRVYNLNGDLLAIENFKWGNKDGVQQYFSMYGDLLREESWKAINPDNPYDTVDVPDLYNPMKFETKVVKMEGNQVRHGLWKFYDPSTGMIVKTERFFLDKLEKNPGTSAEVANEAAAEPREAEKPKQVLDWEKKNSGKKKIKVRDGRTGG